jgi:CO/xanthine dehydrogenase Mo-binding subunit
MATTEHRIVGKPVGRADGPEKVTGRAKYSIDVVLPGTLWCKVLRSPYPHARIRRIDASNALKLPGVHAVLTGDEVRGKRWGKLIQDEPVLAWDRVLYIGDKVAAVAADDEDIAEQALQLIEVEYEELPAVFTIEEAMAADAPILHPEWNSYAGVQKPLEKPSNRVVNMHWEKGNVQEGFAQADLVIEREFRSHRTHQVYLEPHNCVVWIDEEGVLQVWLGTKSPMSNRNHVSAVTGVPADKVNINFAYVGGDFGGKGDILGVPICYALAKKTGRPVKFAMDYTEELMAGNPRHECSMKVRVGVKRDGTITAWESDLYYNGGAYRAYTPGGNLPGSNEIAGPYRIPHTRIDSWVIAANVLPGGFQRGPGEVQGIFAGESMMDVIAEELGMDPVELRLKNVLHEGDETPTGHRFVDIRAEDVIREAARAGGMREPRPKNVGRGIAYGHRPQYGGGSQVAVTVNADGGILARTSIFEPGVGTYTILQQTVAEEMGVAIERVRVVPFSTSEMAPDIFDFGVGGSRGSFVSTQGAAKATAEVKEQLKRLAAEFNGWDESVVAYQDGFLVNERTDQRVPMEEIVQRAGQPVMGRNRAPEEMTSPMTSFVAQVAEVEVDPETGQVFLRKFTAVHDVGKVLNPIGFHGQVEGGLVQGIGGAIMEDIIVDEGGRVTNPSLADYKAPTMRDIPELNTVLLEAPSGGWGQYSVKAVGEHSNITTAPAITNAIYDATGVRIYEIPVHPEKLLRIIQERQPQEEKA